MSETPGSAPSRRALGLSLSVVLVFLFAVAPEAHAQNRLGGHFGAVFPLVTRAGGETTDIGEDFKVGFPMGITVRKSDDFAFDLEIVPVLDFEDEGPIGIPLTIHPGALWSLGGSWTGGLRMAFDINGASWGFTPLLNRGFPWGDNAVFLELVVPIRFQDDVLGESDTAVGVGVHLGMGF